MHLVHLIMANIALIPRLVQTPMPYTIPYSLRLCKHEVKHQCEGKDSPINLFLLPPLGEKNTTH